MTVTAILLAGGQGKRFGGATPKQFIAHRGKPLALHSFEIFSQLEEVTQIIVVCHATYRPLFSSTTPLLFANPGKERQHSLCNALQHLSNQCEWVAIHDAARPFLSQSLFQRTLQGAKTCGAAAPGTPLTSTIKRVDKSFFVTETLPRKELMAIQTPQIIRSDLLFKGMKYIQKEALFVTDDLSVVESIGITPQIVPGDPKNIKITTKQDLPD